MIVGLNLLFDTLLSEQSFTFLALDWKIELRKLVRRAPGDTGCFDLFISSIIFTPLGFLSSSDLQNNLLSLSITDDSASEEEKAEESEELVVVVLLRA
ncbi:unnamed protein product [Arabidopsis thaliana]|uniref:(thale cress) hypothetical protein n=1 Tax=Arabidopsis thaliana TaxID=3702 RepID=A0A7G2EU96_ARATH|nr:unnamed protein product [Arabidopsis thaliana]